MEDIREPNIGVIETPTNQPQPHPELIGFADRIAQLKRRRDELQEFTKLQDEVRRMENLLYPPERSTPSTPALSTSSLEIPTERPARRQRLDSGFMPIAGRGPKIKKIPIFKGKGIREYYDFESQLRIAFRLDPAAFILEDQKIAYTLQYLQPTFRQLWIQRELELDGETPEWSEMMSFLLDQIKSPVNRELQVTILYQKSVQKDSQSVNDFAAYLSTLENQINPPYEQKHLVMHLYSKLRPDIRVALSNYAEFPTTRRELIERAATLEDNLRRSSAFPSTPRRQHTPKSDTTTPSRQSTPYRRNPGAMQASHRSNNTNDPNICYNCGLKGHWAKDCRRKQQEGRPPTSGSNSIQAKN
jgi:hypothetical protein